MIKIVIPKNFDVIAPYFEKPEHKNNLYLTAVDDDELLAILRFMVRGSIVEIYDILAVTETLDVAVADGIIRTALFQAADMGCEGCRAYNISENLKSYFMNHQFMDQGNYFEHSAYVDEFFKPCPGCADVGH